jgi:hypothetical protein
MALLIVQLNGRRLAGTLSGRVLIGRRPESQVRLQDKVISRIHAWIAPDEHGGHYIADAGSRTGTFVNDELVLGRRSLNPGDQVRIGPISLQLAEDDAAPDAEPIDLSLRSPPPPSPQEGIWLDCGCGAPLWVPWDFAGRSGQCRQCGQMIAVPRMTAVAATVSEAAPFDLESRKGEETAGALQTAPSQSRPVPTVSNAFAPARDAEAAESAKASDDPADPTRLCGVCHAEISVFEEATRCRACDAVFHIECWEENRGCSVYGCSQVNALDRSGDARNSPDDTAFADPLDEEAEPAENPVHDASGNYPKEPRPVPWPYALLAAGVAGAVLGSLTFGVTALASAVASLIYMVRAKPQRQRGVVVLSIVVSLTGLVAGVALSYYWWAGGKPWLVMRR